MHRSVLAVAAKRPERSYWVRLMSAALGLVMGFLLIPAMAQPAQAVGASYVYSNSGATNVRYSPYLDSGIVVRLGNFTRVQMLCWTDTQWATGNYASNRWFKVRVDTTGSYSVYNGVTGYVHSSLVRSQTWTPRC